MQRTTRYYIGHAGKNISVLHYKLRRFVFIKTNIETNCLYYYVIIMVIISIFQNQCRITLKTYVFQYYLKLTIWKSRIWWVKRCLSSPHPTHQEKLLDFDPLVMKEEVDMHDMSLSLVITRVASITHQRQTKWMLYSWLILFLFCLDINNTFYFKFIKSYNKSKS